VALGVGNQVISLARNVSNVLQYVVKHVDKSSLRAQWQNGLCTQKYHKTCITTRRNTERCKLVATALITDNF